MEATLSPLLGSAYLKSQSTPSPQPEPATPSLCLNLSRFKAHIKTLRAVDDSIILRINRSDALSRALASSRPNRENSIIGQGECNAFWSELTQGWNGRNSVLAGCLDVMDKSIKVEQYGVENGLDRNRTAMGRGESELQVKRRQMHQEVDIERIIRQRSLDLFRSRCPDHPLSPNPPPLVDPDNPEERERRGRRKGRNESGGVRWNG